MFLDDKEKMEDFVDLTKGEFLKSYSYLTEEEYDETADLLKDKVNVWYKENYNFDELADELNEFTFLELLNALQAGSNIYDLFGVADSVIRERIFTKLANTLNVDYDIIYDLWVK